MKSSAIRFTTTLLVAVTFGAMAVAADAFAVFKSHDGGRSWTRSDAGMPGQSRVNAFGSADEALFAGTDTGIFISRDNSLSWKSGTGAAMSSGRIVSFATVGQNVFAGTDGNGMLVSSDHGESWSLQGTFPSRKVRCLLALNGRLYAGTDAEGVFASDDAERSWSRLSTGLPALGQVFALAAVEGRLFAALYSRGVYVLGEREGS